MSSDEAAEPTASEDGWRLKALHMSEDMPPIPITEAGITIGRADSNDVRLDSDEFPGVSGTHARIVYRDGAVLIEDLESKNGTFVAGEPVDRQPVQHGAVVELGKGGARFVVLSPTQSDQTVIMEDMPKPRRSIGADTVEMVREKLGIPANTDVTEVVQQGNRRNTYLLLVVMVVLVGGGFYVYWEQQSSKSEIQKLNNRFDQQVAASSARFDEVRKTWEQRVDRVETAQGKWERVKAKLDKEKAQLEAKLKAESTTTAELAQLRKQLQETEQRMEKFNPVSLEADRFRRVQSVVQSVAAIEVRQTFVDSQDRELHFSRDSAGDPLPNFLGKGKLFKQESNGSGFCFHKDGWLLTNAHVVLKKDSRNEIELLDGTIVKSKVDVKVVFSGTTVRHAARIVKWAATGSKDLALLKIDAFAGMPFIPGIDTKKVELPVSMDVFVAGFPLGDTMLQEGKKMIASTFRGIVSRSVEQYLQVDAEIHPGNSGGPVIDSTGKVIGVVVGMQRMDGNRSAHAIGYVIPIEYAREVLPDVLRGG